MSAKTKKTSMGDTGNVSAPIRKMACVFGGTGFIGTQIVRELARLGYTVKVATRVPESAYFLKPCGVVGQIVPIACHYENSVSIEKAVAGCEAVVNCVGILYEKGKKGTFQKIHVDLAESVARACAVQGVLRLVHLSALGCAEGRSAYAGSKRTGEKAVLAHFPAATILRPSTVFGPGDRFFNLFAVLARYFPALPLIGGGKTKFQPVYVGDIADAVVRALILPAANNSQSPLGRLYELGGPEILTLEEIYLRLFEQTGQKRRLVNVPFPVASLQGKILGLLPGRLLTADQVESLKTDIIVQKEALTLADLDIVPTGMTSILPSYLKRFRPGGCFVKNAAG